MHLNTTRPCGHGGDAESLSREVKAVLDCSMAAWNAGDLNAFLDCYENSPHTSYLTSDQIVVGYAEIEKLYAERFATVSAARRGILSMSLSRVVPLSADHSLAIGRYMLSRDESNGGSGDGVFSLVLRRTPVGWRIAADHTSG
ncbi:MAG TPA: nuclear transport factor 2 family protein [Steroidobacteraceae bacterium]|jgi:uncharacterized protein (TIGR02246 family)|nr:nuclear transport factor 2 family protein [Steroidobacteraceae bacterium]